jgi:DNA-binding SARP family transcriptional activator/tetratricopeptide (TPR) repeat protein
MCYRIRLIGVVDPRVEGIESPLPARILSLLAYMEQQVGEPASRATICRMLWPGKKESRARHSLSQLLYRIDQLLPDLQLERSPKFLRCSGSLTSDATMVAEAPMRSAAEMLLTFGSSSIASCPLEESEPFRDWWDASTSVLEDRVKRVLRAAAEECTQSGNHARAMRLWEMFFAVGGRDQQAVNSYIGVFAAQEGPDAARAAWLDLSNRDSFASEPLAVPPVLEIAALRLPELGRPLVGRGAEFQVLRSKLSVVQSRRCQVVTILGEAGIGKTRLIQQLERLAAIKGFRILGGKAHAAEQYLPFSAVTDMLAEGFNDRDLDRLPSYWRNPLLAAVPRFAKRSDSIPLGAFELGRTQLIEALSVAVESICEQNSVLLRIDDFQWADQSSIEAISYIMRRLAEAPVLILIGARAEDLISNTHAQELVLGEATDRSTLIHLGPLPPDNSMELLETLSRELNATIDENTRTIILDQTGGRPFYILEAIRHVQQHGAFRESTFDGYDRARPMLSIGSIDAYVAARLRRLPKEQLNVVSAISLLNRHATPEVLEAVLGMRGMPLASALADLEARGLIASEEDRLTFTHDILHDAAYRLTSGAVRKLFHGRAAAELGQRGTVSDGVLSVHYSNAGNRRDAYRHALQAARLAELGYGEWEFFWNLALENASNTDEAMVAREGLLIACLKAQRYTNAEVHAAVLAPHYATTISEAGDLLVTTAKLGASIARAEAKASEVLQQLEDAVLAAQRIGQFSSWMESSNLLIISAHFAGQSEAADRWASILLAAASDASVSTQVRLSTVISHVYGYQGRLEDCDRLTREALTLAVGADPDTQVNALRGRGDALYFAGRLDEAEAYLNQALQLANAKCSHLVPRIENDLATCYLERGALTEALALLTHGLACDTGADTRPIYLANLAIAYYELRDFVQCQSTVGQLLHANEKLDSPWIRYAAHAIAGLTAIEIGDQPTAEYSADVIREYMESEHKVLLGGDQYVAVFYCRFLFACATVEEALAVAEQFLIEPQSQLPLPRLRLLIEKSRILKSTSPDAAWRLAKDVRDEAREHGAWAIVRMAEEILESIPHV